MSTITTDESGYTVIDIGDGIDITVTPNNVATPWKGDIAIRSLPRIIVSYHYPHENYIYTTSPMDGTYAVEFIVTSWIHHRHIVNVEQI